MQFLCTATGIFVFCVSGKGGEICTETERERGGEGEGVSRNDGWKYEREGKVMERRSSLDFVFLSSSFCSSGLCQ